MCYTFDMKSYFDKYDKQIFEMMSNPSWWIDRQKRRKQELLKYARRVHSNSSISSKMGGLLLWQQVLEQFLKEIIHISISYIKAEIWPTRVDLKVNFKNKTFGVILNDYENYSLDYKDKSKILTKLKLVNDNRNTIVHKIFEVDNLENLETYFEESFNTYEDLLPLLLDHYINNCYYLEDLKKRVDWQDFLDDINDK